MSDMHMCRSLHKTYMDCYRMLGFTGGEWTYCTNANHPEGELLDNIGKKGPTRSEERLATYYLGWESIEVCGPLDVIHAILRLKR